MADRDPLTGAYNLERFKREAKELISTGRNHALCRGLC